VWSQAQKAGFEWDRRRIRLGICFGLWWDKRDFFDRSWGFHGRICHRNRGCEWSFCPPLLPCWSGQKKAKISFFIRISLIINMLQKSKTKLARLLLQWIAWEWHRTVKEVKINRWPWGYRATSQKVILMGLMRPRLARNAWMANKPRRNLWP